MNTEHFKVKTKKVIVKPGTKPGTKKFSMLDANGEWHNGFCKDHEVPNWQEGEIVEFDKVQKGEYWNIVFASSSAPREYKSASTTKSSESMDVLNAILDELKAIKAVLGGMPKPATTHVDDIPF